MHTQLVLTLVGPDRPGLVEALSDEIARVGGNWEQSRMARLDDMFAGILRVSVPTARSADLASALRGLERHGLKIVVAASKKTTEQKSATALQLEVVGNDRSGIVRDIARVLAQRGVNVDELHTQCEPAPMGGGQLFRARALLQLPQGLSVADLTQMLESIADDLMVDIAATGAEPRRG